MRQIGMVRPSGLDLEAQSNPTRIYRLSAALPYMNFY
jgi:hypothetical protein